MDSPDGFKPTPVEYQRDTPAQQKVTSETAIGIDAEASSLIPHPSSLIPHPSSLIPHPSSLIPHPSSLIPHPSNSTFENTGQVPEVHFATPNSIEAGFVSQDKDSSNRQEDEDQEEQHTQVEQALAKVNFGEFEGEAEMPEITKRLKNPRSAARSMVGRYKEWARSIGFDTDDLEQEAVFAIWEADQKIDEMKANGTWVNKYGDNPLRSEQAFLFNTMRLRMKAVLDRNNKYGPSKSESVEAMTEERGDHISGDEDVEERIITGVLTNEYLRVAATELLNDSERKILAGVLQGKKTTEIAQSVGLKPGSISNSVGNIVIKFRSYFGVDPTLPIEVFREANIPRDEELTHRAQEAGVTREKQYQKEYYAARKSSLQEKARERMRDKRASTKDSQIQEESMAEV